MKDLPSALRKLADLCEANGGEIPKSLFPTPPPVTQNLSPKQIAKAIAKKHFYGKASNHRK